MHSVTSLESFYSVCEHCMHDVVQCEVLADPMRQPTARIQHQEEECACELRENTK